MGLFGGRKKAEAEQAAANMAGAEMSEELVAVISAAIAAQESKPYIQTLYIKKFNRAAGVRPVWNIYGMSETIDARRM